LKHKKKSAGYYLLKHKKKSAGFSQRSRIDIIACILKHAKDVSRKTRLIYGCNLSLSQFNKYALCLIESGLLDKNQLEGIEFYETTDKGLIFLEDYVRISKVLQQMHL
jgi:predicted transcriptional regulator